MWEPDICGSGLGCMPSGRSKKPCSCADGCKETTSRREIAIKTAIDGRVEAVLDLGTSNSDQELSPAFQNPDQETCLWIGSPVYVDHPVPPIETFISRLPQSRGSCAVLFATWRGTSLYEMAPGLIRKGYVLIGAATTI
jgi:hypothetical protein